jgi:hypothetical protein
MKTSKSNSPSEAVTLADNGTLKTYQTVEESTGEVVSTYKYLEGHPRQYRFDGATCCL